jgi:AAA domain
MAKKNIVDRIREPTGKFEHFGACIFGVNGAGKTTLLGTAQGRGLVLDVKGVEQGADLVLAHHGKRIKVLDINDWDDLNEAYHMLRRKEYECDWVGIDTATSVQIIAKRKVLKLRDDADLRVHEVRLKDWGGIGELMGEMFLKFRALPIDTYFLAQERLRKEDYDDPDSDTIITPDMTPAALKMLMPHCDLIGRMFVAENGDGKVVRNLLVETRPGRATKSRNVKGHKLPAVIEHPNLGQIKAYMQGNPDVKKPRAASDGVSSSLD